jgi:SlyX protein
MTEIADLEQRLNELEAHVAHQDAIIEDLNEVSLQQWDEINSLKEKIEFLRSKLQAAEDAKDDKPAKEPPPPHY